jgi:DEAD/DEAH box helicase domain-containing protein
MAELQDVRQVLRRWLRSGGAHDFCCHRTLPARAAACCALPAWLDARLAAALRASGVDALYLHQGRAAEAARAGRDVVVATPTASGKTLCYNLPVFQALLDDPAARALYLFPTKALARDQVEGARSLAAALGAEAQIGVAGDQRAAPAPAAPTPAEQRRAARRRARIIATNPEMLHSGVLPHHPAWAELLAGLRYVVVDELHTYRGVFGSHVANVLRRLLRLARFHGAEPRLIATSATIANPGELGARLFGRVPDLVDESGAPQGERHVLIFNPPLVDPAIGLRESYLRAACRLARDLEAARVCTLVFCRSRLATEVLLRHLRDAVARRARADAPGTDGAPPEVADRVRGYRGGYLPDRRREVERALREGEASVVVTTSALELGIDIGSLDAVVIAGWPGSRAALWQRAGRAGRRMGPSLVVLVASSEPVDQYVAAEPDYLLGQAPEHARVDPDNPSILIPHLTCGAFELPFQRGERYGALAAEETADVLACLAEAGRLHASPNGSYHYVGDAYPAAEVSLRGPLAENFAVIEEPAGEVIAEVDHHDAPEVLFEGAIYQLEGRQLAVERLDHDQRKAFVRAVRVDYYTDAMTQTRVRILEEQACAGSARWGEVHVVHRVVGFKKIKLHTGENIGYGEVALPDREMHTTALWLRPSPARVRRLGASAAAIAEAALGAGHVLHTSAALLLMSDARDLGRAVGDARSSWFAVGGRAQRGGFAVPDDEFGLPAAPSAARGPEFALDGALAPVLFLFDSFPGGTGLAEQLFELRAELCARARRSVLRCGCERGCPACIGPGGTAAGKRLAAQLLELLARDGEAEADAARAAAGSCEATP